MIKSEAEEALREAHLACPCYAVQSSAYVCCEASEDDERCCEHCGFPEHKTGKPCRWPGHAAIDALGRATYLAGVEVGIKQGMLAGQERGAGAIWTPLPSWIQKE